ncbi:MAG: hypothetical protein LBR19_07120 [Bifidobacteriaceae bacterium]|jgi:uncharacterized protein YbaR (Trm112 family)|nr:hypothetical protein [Bifidobacteriaceae bacterium]
MDQWVRSVLRCPVCKGELVDQADSLACEACAVAYPVDGGVPGLLAHRASPLEQVP